MSLLDIDLNIVMHKLINSLCPIVTPYDVEELGHNWFG